MRFSRFEYALKKNDYLKNRSENAKAQPDWNKYIEDFEADYIATPAAIKLLSLKPLKQIVDADASLKFVELSEKDDECSRGLKRVVDHLHVVRNNLFHGGKHGPSTLQNNKRNRELLEICISVMDALPKGCLEDDYLNEY